VKTSSWAKLEKQAGRLRGRRIDDLFAADSDRYHNFSLLRHNMVLDYSRQLLDDDALDELLKLPDEFSLGHRIAGLFGGERVNNTENRAALHMALRADSDADFAVDDVSVMEDVDRVRDDFLAFADDVRNGERTGHSGKAFTTVVNIGVGGSHLGPMLVADALADENSPDCFFVSGAGGQQLLSTLSKVDPETTLFVVCSKSFSTQETMLNAEAAREWLAEQLSEEAVADHFAAVSVNQEAMDEFGIADDARFEMWNWVGGRYSVWSAVGLAAAIVIGSEAFRDLLSGARTIDNHFRNAPWAENLPVMLALIELWNRNFLRMNSHAVLPYERRLQDFPEYLQQLEMESLGKSVQRDGEPVESATVPVIWGTHGSNAQHSYLQALHQGTLKVFVDFIGVASTEDELAEHKQVALANMLAQAEALRSGRSVNDVGDSEIAKHRVQPGNVPSVILLLKDLDPVALGSLIALYEHKVFALSVFWDINPFDQWGVELGKTLAGKYEGLLSDDIASTEGDSIVNQIRDWQEG